MKIHGIEDLTKKDMPLYYRNDYEALGDLEIAGGRFRIPMSFSVEIKPTGERVISVKLHERIDYPLLPVVQALKERIRVMEKDGHLR